MAESWKERLDRLGDVGDEVGTVPKCHCGRRCQLTLDHDEQGSGGYAHITSNADRAKTDSQNNMLSSKSYRAGWLLRGSGSADGSIALIGSPCLPSACECSISFFLEVCHVQEGQTRISILELLVLVLLVNVPPEIS